MKWRSARGRRRSTTRCAGEIARRESGCSIAFATRGSARAGGALQHRVVARARRPARPAAAPRPVESSARCGAARRWPARRTRAAVAARRPLRRGLRLRRRAAGCGEPVDCGDCGDEGDCEKPGEASPVVGSPPSLPRSVLVCVGDCSVDEQARCGRRARVAKAVAQAAMQPGATQCAIVAGRAAVDADALILALAELPESDTAAVADDELARGVALVQQVHHYL